MLKETEKKHRTSANQMGHSECSSDANMIVCVELV